MSNKRGEASLKVFNSLFMVVGWSVQPNPLRIGYEWSIGVCDVSSDYRAPPHNLALTGGGLAR